jgi:hypothetical protein
LKNHWAASATKKSVPGGSVMKSISMPTRIPRQSLQPPLALPLPLKMEETHLTHLVRLFIDTPVRYPALSEPSRLLQSVKIVLSLPTTMLLVVPVHHLKGLVPILLIV